MNKCIAAFCLVLMLTMILDLLCLSGFHAQIRAFWERDVTKQKNMK